MRRTFVLFTVAGVLVISAVAQSPKRVNSQDAEQLRKIEAATGQFEQTNDWSKMDLLADDWIFTGNGKVLSKKQFEKT